MSQARFGLGDLVTHREGGGPIFVIEGWLEPVDPNDLPLYQCSQTNHYEFGWHNYIGADLKEAHDVPEERKPDAIKRASMVLNRLLELTQEGGMRHKRAEQLHEEFCDHWLQNDDPQKMDILSNTLDHLEELLQKTRNGS